MTLSFTYDLDMVHIYHHTKNIICQCSLITLTSGLTVCARLVWVLETLTITLCMERNSPGSAAMLEWTEGRTDEQTDGQMNRRTDGWTDGRMNRRTDSRLTLMSGLTVCARLVWELDTLTITLCIRLNSPGRAPCWTTPSTFRVNPVSFCTVTGSFWLRGWGEMASWNKKI